MGQVALLEEHTRALSDASSIAATLSHIARVVSVVGSVQGILLRNLYALQTAAFYACAAGAALAATSAHRTARARAPLVLGLVAAAALELALVAQQGHGAGGAELAGSARRGWAGWLVAAAAALAAALAAAAAGALTVAARALLPLAALDAVLAACHTAEPLASSFAAAWGASDFDAFRLAQARWAVRWAFLAAAGLGVVYSAVAYVDYSAASHALLCELLERLGPLRRVSNRGELEDAQSPHGLLRAARTRALALWRLCCVRVVPPAPHQPPTHQTPPHQPPPQQPQQQHLRPRGICFAPAAAAVAAAAAAASAPSSRPTRSLCSYACRAPQTGRCCASCATATAGGARAAAARAVLRGEPQQQSRTLRGWGGRTTGRLPTATAVHDVAPHSHRIRLTPHGAHPTLCPQE